MAGWFKVERAIQDHSIWKSREPFDRRSAWIDLILLANYKDFKTMYKGKIVHRKRGEVNTSIVYLAQRWRWDRRKVKRFLDALEGDSMVTVSSTTDGTTITIENYGKYQDVGTTHGTADGTSHSTTDGTTHGTADGTYDKKTKEYYKEIIIKEGEEYDYYPVNDDDEIPGT